MSFRTVYSNDREREIGKPGQGKQASKKTSRREYSMKMILDALTSLETSRVTTFDLAVGMIGIPLSRRGGVVRFIYLPLSAIFI